MTARAVKFLTVPPGTKAKPCRGPTCTAVLYWIETERGRRMPVDCAVDGGRAPTATEAGQGVSHFATCRDADRFRNL